MLLFAQQLEKDNHNKTAITHTTSKLASFQPKRGPVDSYNSAGCTVLLQHLQRTVLQHNAFQIPFPCRVPPCGRALQRRRANSWGFLFPSAAYGLMQQGFDKLVSPQEQLLTARWRLAETTRCPARPRPRRASSRCPGSKAGPQARAVGNASSEQLLQQHTFSTGLEKDDNELRSLLNRVTLDVAERPLQEEVPLLPSTRSPGAMPLHTNNGKAGFPVYVMLPLDTVWLIDCADGEQMAVIKRENALELGLSTLKQAGVEGVMVDVWWGIVEREPEVYDFSAYERLFKRVQAAGLKIQAVMSFHAAGGNVGDTCKIPLPKWVLDVGDEQPGIFYSDKHQQINRECLSLGCDNEAVLHGRTPVKVYSDFVAAFADSFGGMFGDTLQEVTVGLGPAGELRYPSYPEGDGRWRFPGVGEFQCYDPYMLGNLRQTAEALGQPEWGLSGPHDAGSYNSRAYDTAFFRDGGSWTTPYGHFFLDWYSGQLVQHADRVLGAVSEVLYTRGRPRRAFSMVEVDAEEEPFQEFRIEPAVKLGLKLAGVHWWFRTASHASELTAGYYNTRCRDGYDPILSMAAKYNARISFTCVEMRDCEHPDDAMCSPQGLLRQVIDACHRRGVSLAGENALQRYDEYAFDRIIESALGQNARAGNLEQLTFLRMGDLMWDNFDAFRCFLRRLRSGIRVC